MELKNKLKHSSITKKSNSLYNLGILLLYFLPHYPFISASLCCFCLSFDPLYSWFTPLCSHWFIDSSSSLFLTPLHIFPFSPPLTEFRAASTAGTCCDLWPLPSCPAGSLQSLRANTGTSPGNPPPRPLAAAERQQDCVTHIDYRFLSDWLPADGFSSYGCKQNGDYINP